MLYTSNDTATRMAVTETMYRFAAGIDLKDSTLLASSFTEDAVSDFRLAAAKAGFDYPVLTGRDTIVVALAHSLGPLDTTHSVSNPRVTVEGDKARLETIIEAQHVPKSDPSRHYLMKNRYDVELIKSGDHWLIQRVTVDNVWRSGDPAVLAGV